MGKNLITTGDQFAEKGTQAWADWQRSRMRNALKGTNFECRQLVQIIRDMCEPERAGAPPAWHLMTRFDGEGFRTFAEFVTAPPPEGLGFPDYPKFRAISLSEPAVMSEREYDLLTAPREKGVGGRPKAGENPNRRDEGFTSPRETRLRAIRRAPAKVQELYLAGLISQELAAAMGGKNLDEGKRAEVASRLEAMNGTATRQTVEAVVRGILDRRRATLLDVLKRTWAKASAAERRAFRDWMAQEAKP